MASPRIQPMTPRWIRGKRSVVLMLIGLNVLLFLAQTAVSGFQPGWIDEWLALSMDGIRHGCVWQFITYMFVHGDPSLPATGAVHLLLNMLMLYFAGREVEAIAGPRHLLGMYFLGGLAGGVAQILASPASQPVGGSSAGVCAVLLAFTTILPEVEVTVLLLFVIPIRMRAKFLGWILAGSSAVLGAMHLLPVIAHFAHLGGCFTGWVYARQLGFGNPWWLQRRRMERRLREERLARMSPTQFMVEEIDPILDKICREGMRSLTRAERKILARGREKIGQVKAGAVNRV